MPSLLITGSDTSVGKTVITTIIASYLLHQYPEKSLGILKPVQTGEGDREYYQKMLPIPQALHEICPQFFSTPLAPPLAAEKEGRPVDLALLWQQYEQLRMNRSFVLVEGAGGIGSPITWEYTVADLARDWHLPTLLVVPVRLGSMTQAITSAALARLLKVDLRGIIFNCVQPYAESEVNDLVAPDRMGLLTQVPILGVVPCLETIYDTQKLAAIGANLPLELLGL